jgi:hypothetical protein
MKKKTFFQNNKEFLFTVLPMLVIVTVAMLALVLVVLPMLADSFVEIGQILNTEVWLENECAALGYPEYVMSRSGIGGEWNYFCVGLVDGTSVTVPLEELYAFKELK